MVQVPEERAELTTRVASLRLDVSSSGPKIAACMLLSTKNSTAIILTTTVAGVAQVESRAKLA